LEPSPNPNSRAAAVMMDEFARSGVAHACISPGSRSTALVTGILRAPAVRPWVILDERSAGFFALGIARETRRPVILVCTSGTAAANYMPAVVEASLSKIPLIVITADRPPEARDCRSAQTIDQVRMFGSHARWSVDLAPPAAGLDLDSYYRTIACRAFATAAEMPAGPVHLNLPMREPLIDVSEERERLARIGESESEGESEFAADESRPPYTRVYPARPSLPPDSIGALAAMIRGCDRGLIVSGPAAPSPDAACSIARLAERLNWPILADPLSGLRVGRHDRSRIVDAYDVLLRDPAFCEANQPDAVIQFGDPPVSKSLGQFLASRPRRCHLMVAEPGTWPDPLQIASDVAQVGTVELCDALFESLDDPPKMSPWLDSWLAASARSRAALDEMLADETTMFEGKVVAELMRLAPDGCAVHTGNSMLVRDFDTFVGQSDRDTALFCNRGANGIDGVLATALGAAAARKAPTVLVLGDLSLLHDIGALQIAARYSVHLLVIVINNDGGGIFSFLPQASLGDNFETFFATPHGLDFERASALGGARYARAGSWSEFNTAVGYALDHPGLHLLEIRGDRAANLAMHRRLIEMTLTRLHATAGEKTIR
jgi:2-succinyl-5-enolpyruvyl-6-hydroxy-3-cyclohexene-1-carboxylate synthase